MKKIIYLLILSLIVGCAGNEKKDPRSELAIQVRYETKRAWNDYKKYAWGMDVLLPISKQGKNWYENSLGISPIDAFSTLAVMGLTEEADEVIRYVTDSLDFDKDMFVKVFEVNIRVLGGLLSMYQLSGKEEVLEKAKDFADRLLPAYQSATGIPYYWVNLKTGETKGEEVNVAEAGTNLLEMGMMSYFTGDPVYYRASRKAVGALFHRRSGIGLVGEAIDVESGEWTRTTSHICAGIDSYYEYLYKGWLLFGDEELKAMWDSSIVAINSYLPEVIDGRLWYGRVNMYTGEHTSSVVTLYDAFFPAILAISGDPDRAGKLEGSWNWLWNKHGLEPMSYDYRQDSILNPEYDLNPEIIESAYYLHSLTGDPVYLRMLETFWNDLLKHCKTEAAFTSVKNVITMEKRDYMATFFFAETLKYFYLSFSDQDMVTLESTVFNTEAHPFLKAAMEESRIRRNLGLSARQG